jgi:Protein of unknown function (DUF1214)
MLFERHELPPAQAFWSLTAYDDDGYVPPNEFGKYLLRDRDPLEFAADGSLQVVIQRRPPEGPSCRRTGSPARTRASTCASGSTGRYRRRSIDLGAAARTLPRPEGVGAGGTQEGGRRRA